MSDYRADSILTGSDYRVGSILYVAVGVRSVGSVSPDAGLPGDLVEIALNGTWDAGGKTATLNGISLTISAQSATYIRFTVPTPYADGSSYSTLNLDTVYDLVVDDSNVNPKTGSFRITSPSAPTYWYISSITGSPWGETSIFDGATGLSNGDSAIVEVTAGGPLTSVGSDGLWVSTNPVRFRAKAFNVDGWSTAWTQYTFGDTSAPLVTSAAVSSDGQTVTLVFDEVVVVTTGTPTLSVSASAGATTATYASGTSTTTLVFTLARTIGVGETVYLSYTQPGNGLEDITGDDLASFTSYPATNGTTVLVPTVIGTIPNRSLLQNVAASIDYSHYFLGAAATNGYSLHAGTWPTGMTLNANTGVLSGTPTTVQSRTGLVVRVTDGSTTADSNSFSINIITDSSKPSQGPKRLKFGA